MRMWSRGVSKCADPYQAASWSGSVHARKTTARDAATVRSTETVRSQVVTVGSVTSVLLGLGGACRAGPSAAVRVEPVHPLLPGPPALRRQARGQRLREPVHRRLTLGEAAQDGPARRVRERREGRAERIGTWTAHGLINLAGKQQLS